MSNNNDDSSSSKVVGNNDFDHDDKEEKINHHDDDHHHHHHDMVRDVMMWQRGKLSSVLLVGVTAIWVLFEVYHFKLIPLASWLAMAFVSLLFLYGSFQRLLGREVPKMEEWEITEERCKDMALAAKQMMEKGIRWMFHVCCEREWYIFGTLVSSLLLLAYLAHHFHLLTLLYAGTVMGMTVPLLYKKREKEMKAFGDRLRKHASSQGYMSVIMTKSKMLSKLKPKQKKVE